MEHILQAVVSITRAPRKRVVGGGSSPGLNIRKHRKRRRALRNMSKRDVYISISLDSPLPTILEDENPPFTPLIPLTVEQERREQICIAFYITLQIIVFLGLLITVAYGFYWITTHT